jgi:rRNA pseudouridine-1189 N-methylase Emg1 (Nep1/Mra1 family)
MCLQTYQLLNPDEHANFLRKQNKKPDDYRPDICHQVGSKMFLLIIFSLLSVIEFDVYVICFLVVLKWLGSKLLNTVLS